MEKQKQNKNVNFPKLSKTEIHRLANKAFKCLGRTTPVKLCMWCLLSIQLTVPESMSWGHEFSRWLLQTLSSVNFILWRMLSPETERAREKKTTTTYLTDRFQNYTHGHLQNTLFYLDTVHVFHVNSTNSCSNGWGSCHVMWLQLLLLLTYNSWEALFTSRFKYLSQWHFKCQKLKWKIYESRV